MNRERVGVVLVYGSSVLAAHRATIAEHAAKRRLQTMSTPREWMDADFLMSYGTSLNDMYRRAPYFVDRILTGAKPADLPVEQPTKFELVISQDCEGARPDYSVVCLGTGRPSYRVIMSEETPVPRPRGAGRPSTVAPYAPLVAHWLREDPDLSGAEILRRVRLAGYRGGKSALYELVRRLRVRHPVNRVESS